MFCWLLWWQGGGDMSWQVCNGWHGRRRDNAGLWHSHHPLTCTHRVLITCQWSVCNSLYASLATKSDWGGEIYTSSRMSWGMILFIHMCELWESLYLGDIPRSQCSEYVTFHVDCTGVHTACTPSVQVYTPSRTIHSVVRRPQRGQHRWSPLCGNKWNNL